MNQTTLNQLIGLLQGDLPRVENPYAYLADCLGLTEAQVVACLQDLQDQGKLKRIAAVLHHQQTGFAYNAMAVFVAAEASILSLGPALAASPLVSHCYQRQSYPQWPYNLYAMLHSRQPEAIEEFVRDFAANHGLDQFLILPSVEELKKTSMVFTPAP